MSNSNNDPITLNRIPRERKVRIKQGQIRQAFNANSIFEYIYGKNNKNKINPLTRTKLTKTNLKEIYKKVSNKVLEELNEPIKNEKVKKEIEKRNLKTGVTRAESIMFNYIQSGNEGTFDEMIEQIKRGNMSINLEKKHIMHHEDEWLKWNETSTYGVHKNTYKYTLLGLACLKRRQKMVDYLIKKGAKMDDIGDGTTALHIALKYSLTGTIVNKLINGGADVNKNTNGVYPIHIACERGKIAMLNSIIKGGANINKKVKITGNTPLHISCKMNDDKIINILIKHRCDVNIENDKGETSLMKICSKKNYSMIRLLIRNGANVNKKDNNGKDALWHFANSITNVYNNTNNRRQTRRTRSYRNITIDNLLRPGGIGLRKSEMNKIVKVIMNAGGTMNHITNEMKTKMNIKNLNK